MKTKKFSVEGMTCASCVAHVEKSVQKLEGVASVHVQLMTNSMTVTFEEDRLPVEAIENSVHQAGYEARLLEEGIQKTTPADSVFEEQMQLKKRFWVSLGFLLLLMYLSMGHMFELPLPGFWSGYANLSVFALSQFLLTLPIVYVNRSFFAVGFRTLFKGLPTMDSLIALGASAAVVYGVYALFQIGYGYGHNDAELVTRFAHDLYFESAATILTLITLGRYLEARSKGKTSEAISKLLNLAPKVATVLRSGVELLVPVEEVQVGDEVVLKPGQSAAVDGVVLSGASSMDESGLTGESLPVFKQIGDRILSASVNQTGSLIYRATKVGKDTTLAQMIQLVEEAASSKAPISRLADRISAVFVPIVIGIALLSTLVWILLGYPFDFALSIGISVLVISCPCALGLATPVAIMVGTGKGAELGVLFKSAEALERAHRVEAVVLDKTGTLTEGKPVVTEIRTAKGVDPDFFLRVCATLEKRSEHPFSQAVLDAASDRNLHLSELEGFQSVTGLGLTGVVGGLMYRLGSLNFMHSLDIHPENFEQLAETFAEQGKTILMLADDTRVLGLLAVEDRLKADSKEAVEQLKQLGLDVWMLTGDQKRTAEAVGKQVGISQVFAEVLPPDKADKVANLQSLGKRVVMVGDGINDAPALARADVGIAIGNGSDIAIESADVVLMSNRLTDVATALRLSRSVVNNIQQNLFWAFFYNILGIPLAAGVFYVFFGWKLNPMVAAAAMSFSSVSVVLNALRLRKFKSFNVIGTKMEQKTLIVEGMSCGHCSSRVEMALNAIDGVKAKVDLEEKTASLELSKPVSDEILKKAVEAAGYEVSEVC